MVFCSAGTVLSDYLVTSSVGKLISDYSFYVKFFAGEESTNFSPFTFSFLIIVRYFG